MVAGTVQGTSVDSGALPALCSCSPPDLRPSKLLLLLLATALFPVLLLPPPDAAAEGPIGCRSRSLGAYIEDPKGSKVLVLLLLLLLLRGIIGPRGPLLLRKDRAMGLPPAPVAMLEEGSAESRCVRDK